jgi:CheY-like chemotaxis protein
MPINALVVTRTGGAIKVLVAAFAELGMEYRICGSVGDGVEILSAGYHSAVVVDFDLPNVLSVAKMARTLPQQRRPVLLGMIGAAISVSSAFQAGANFVLYKPLDLLPVLHTFRAARGFMHEDRRRAPRKKRESLAYLQFPTGIIPALVLDVTEQGLSLQAAEVLTPLRGVPLRFLLPETDQVVCASGDFIWADGHGRGGVFFSKMPAGCRRDLETWLKRHGAKRSEAVSSLLEPRGSDGILAVTQ